MNDTFHSLAGIAVGFAGFTGMVLALRSPRDDASASVARSRLVDLLFASLGVVFFAFLPEAVSGFVSFEAMWRTCALLFALYHLLEVAIAAKVGGSLVFTRLDWLLIPFGGIVLTMQIVTGLGWFEAYLQAVYLLAMLWLLFVAAYQFAQLLIGDDR
jgi:hypothetical protein